jgi:branched-chain amino acid aminotransferase
MNSYFNGKYMPLDDVRISPLDFGFIHNEATYDVMRGLTFFDKHYERFCKNCEYYGFPKPDRNELLEVIGNLLEGDMFIWLIAWKGAPPSGSPRDLTGPNHFLVYTKPYYPIKQTPVTVDIIDDLPRSPGYQEHKNFSWIELTRAQQLTTSDTAIVRSVDGYINEGPGFGICFIGPNGVWTPKTDVLNSVTIQVVEEICHDLGISFQRRDFRNHFFQECFLCSTSGGITPVSQIHGHTYKHDITLKIKTAYDGFYRS